MFFDNYTSFEPNNTASLAAELTSGTYQIESQGQDWYRFEANPGVMSLTMTPSDGLDVNMVLYNSKMQVIASNFGAGVEVIDYTVSATDTYYLNVFPTATPGARYAL